MPFIFKRLALLLSIAGAFAADKNTPFRPAPAGSLPYHQTNDKVTIGVEPYDSGEKVKTAFGKLDPYEHGVLPVLVVIQNDTDSTIRADKLQVVYLGPKRSRIAATPANEVKYLRGVKRPTTVPGPTGPIVLKGKKNPLESWEIEGRAFNAKMIPPGQTAHGFFYFHTALDRGASIYINGLAEARTGNELFYFEIPME